MPSYLLTEDGDNLDTEDGDKIILEDEAAPSEGNRPRDARILRPMRLITR
jgi:hypothetical protein